VDPTGLSIARIAGAVREGDITAGEVVSAHLERSHRLQPDLNAYTLIDDGALARAEVLDRRRRSGESLGLLAGVPIGLKDLIDQAGLPTTCGSSFYRQVPDHQATVVERLEEAGAVIVGRTGLHEWAFGFSSENPWWGPVRNPWNLAASPGGSSGGSAAAVAARLAAGAIGTDTGGSVRVPAALCGVVGLKVTHGRIPLTGVFPLAPSLDTVGPLGRSIEDVELLYLAMAGPDPSDPWSVPRPVEEPSPTARLEGLRIGIPQPWLEGTPVAGDVHDAFRAALDGLADHGADVREVVDPTMVPPGRSVAIINAEAASVHRHWFPSRADEYGREVAERLAETQEITLDDYLDAQAWRSGLRQAAARAFAEVEVLITPATAVSVKLIGEDLIEVEGKAHHYRRLLSAFSSLVNHMGNPALVLPLNLEGEPAPALQLIGPRWGERLLLGLGRAMEEAGVVRDGAAGARIGRLRRPIYRPKR
jgi:aspartyl-tRNA(Asn)/glutamyl-tRNA(Gln) amidotransferase subunit A